MPWYVADYLADTTHLSTERHGAYCLMLMAAWKRGGTLPKDDQQLAEVTKLGMAKWKASKEVLLELFKDNGTHYSHKRVTEEWTKAQAISEKKAAAGAKGGTAKQQNRSEDGGTAVAQQVAQGVADAIAEAKQTATPARVSLPSPIPLKSEIPGADAPLSPAVLPTAPSPEPESTSSEEPGIPACPHQRLLRLFREKVPELPQPRRELWEGSKGADAMRQRWHWLMTAKRDTGDRYATTTDAGIEWMGNFFERVQESDFLCGRSGKWRCDLAWLMQRDNFRKVIEHGYPNKEMA